jgi:integrase/recombinase XerC
MSKTYESAVRSFLDYLKFQKRYSRHTLISYGNDLEGFGEFQKEQFGGLSLSEIRGTHIRSWMAGLKEGGMTAKSINLKISALKSFFKFQLREEQVKASPVTGIIVPKISKRLPKYVEKEEVQTLFESVEFPDSFLGHTQRLVLELLYSTGMRQSELLNLRENHVDFSNSSIKVLGKGSKERIIPLGKAMIVALREYMDEKRRDGIPVGEGYLFTGEGGKKLYPKYLYNLTVKYLSLVTTSEKKSPHVLRHSFATHLTNNGADLNAVKELLGHSSLAATQVYTHNNIEKLREVHKKAHPRG